MDRIGARFRMQHCGGAIGMLTRDSKRSRHRVPTPLVIAPGDLPLPAVETVFGDVVLGTKVPPGQATTPPLLQESSPVPLFRRIPPFGSGLWHGHALLSEGMLPARGRWVHRTDTKDCWGPFSIAPPCLDAGDVQGRRKNMASWVQMIRTQE